MKLYFVLSEIAGTDNCEIYRICYYKEDAIFEAQQQNKIRPATCYDIYEIEAVKVYDGKEG